MRTLTSRVASRHMLRTATPDGNWSDYPTQDPSAPWTIWGRAQVMYEIVRGVRWFSTAGHGGMAVADGVARKVLTPAAYKLGSKEAGYVWYEEDVAYAIPFYEHPEWYEVLRRKAGGGSGSKESFEKVIRSYYPKYFDMIESGEAHPAKAKVGMRIRFTTDTRFGSGTVVPAGAEGTVFKVTGSMLYVTVDEVTNPSGYKTYDYRVRMPVRDFGGGLVPIAGTGRVASHLDLERIDDGGRQSFNAGAVYAHVWFDAGVSQSDAGLYVPDSGEWQVRVTTSADPLNMKPRGRLLASRDFRYAESKQRSFVLGSAEDFIRQSFSRYRNT